MRLLAVAPIRARMAPIARSARTAAACSGSLRQLAIGASGELYVSDTFNNCRAWPHRA